MSETKKHSFQIERPWTIADVYPPTQERSQIAQNINNHTRPERNH